MAVLDNSTAYDAFGDFGPTDLFLESGTEKSTALAQAGRCCGPSHCPAWDAAAETETLTK